MNRQRNLAPPQAAHVLISIENLNGAEPNIVRPGGEKTRLDRVHTTFSGGNLYKNSSKNKSEFVTLSALTANERLSGNKDMHIYVMYGGTHLNRFRGQPPGPHEFA